MKKLINKITPATAIVGIACMAGAMGQTPKAEAAEGAAEKSQVLITNVSFWDGRSDKGCGKRAGAQLRPDPENCHGCPGSQNQGLARYRSAGYATG